MYRNVIMVDKEIEKSGETVLSKSVHTIVKSPMQTGKMLIVLDTPQTEGNRDVKDFECVREVRVTRQTIVEDVLNEYKDSTILQCSLAVDV